MPVYKDPKPSKNGNCWFFKINFQDSFGNNRQKKSKKYATKKEAQDAERIYLVTSTNKVEDNNMTSLSDGSNTNQNIANDISNDEIQSKFDNAKDGDTFVFTDKEYNDISLVVDKKLNILSKNASIVYSSDK